MQFHFSSCLHNNYYTVFQLVKDFLVRYPGFEHKFVTNWTTFVREFSEFVNANPTSYEAIIASFNIDLSVEGEILPLVTLFIPHLLNLSMRQFFLKRPTCVVPELPTMREIWEKHRVFPPTIRKVKETSRIFSWKNRAFFFITSGNIPPVIKKCSQSYPHFFEIVYFSTKIKELMLLQKL